MVLSFENCLGLMIVACFVWWGLFCGFRTLFFLLCILGLVGALVSLFFVLLVVAFCFEFGCFLLLSFDLLYLCLFAVVVYVWVETTLFTTLAGWCLL